MLTLYGLLATLNDIINRALRSGQLFRIFLILKAWSQLSFLLQYIFTFNIHSIHLIKSQFQNNNLFNYSVNFQINLNKPQMSFCDQSPVTKW